MLLLRGVYSPFAAKALNVFRSPTSDPTGCRMSSADVGAFVTTGTGSHFLSVQASAAFPDVAGITPVGLATQPHVIRM